MYVSFENIKYVIDGTIIEAGSEFQIYTNIIERKKLIIFILDYDKPVYTIAEYIYIKRLETIAKIAKDRKPIRQSVYEETKDKLKIHDN